LRSSLLSLGHSVVLHEFFNRVGWDSNRASAAHEGQFFLRNSHARIVAGFKPSRSAVSGTDSNRCIVSTSEHDHLLRILGI
jgi:hypothetical protein